MDLGQGWHEESRRKWNALAVAWTDAGPPASPSEDDVEHFLAELGSLPTLQRIAILGSTPRLRLATLRSSDTVRLYIIDFSEQMYSATSRLVPDDMRKRETLVLDDWTSLAGWPDEPYDAMLGDKALDNLPMREWRSFFERTRQRLSTQGSLILHVAYPDPAMKGRGFEDIYGTWETRVSRGETTVDLAAAGCWEDFLSASASEGSRYLSIKPYWPSVQAAASEGAELAMRISHLFAGSIEGRWTNFNQADVVANSAEWFELASVRTSDDYAGCKWQPIVSLRPI